MQDPTQPNIQYVAEQQGRIRVVINGALQDDDYLDLTGIVRGGGEIGLFGMAFAPDYASSGRLFVNYIGLEGHTVVSRFTRAPGQITRGDFDSRFDLVWPDGNAFVTQPYCHYGATSRSALMVFVSVWATAAGRRPITLPRAR